MGCRLTRRSETLERLIEAYGGEDCWRSARQVEAKVWAWGLAFSLKWQPAMRAVEVEAAVRRPYVLLRPPHWGGMTGVLEGSSCRLEDPAGRVVAERADARSKFPYGRRALWWDRLDQIYFSGYALWNYLAFPAILMRSDVECEEVAPGLLDVRFPHDLPTHSRRQRLHVEMPSGRLHQLDYTAEVFGSWARAANVVLEHASWEGVTYPCRRRVTPRGFGDRAWRGPVLVNLEISSWRLV